MRLVYLIYILMLAALCACVAEVGERDNPFDEGADLTAYERDVSGWSKGSDGDVMRGNISGSCYVYEDGAWRTGNNLDCDLGLGGCIVSLQDSLRKGNGWYKCDTLTWRPASAIETDTAGWGKAKDGVVRAGQVNEGIHYIYEASENAWRKATDIEKDTAGWGSSFKETATKNGNVNTEKCYVFENKNWRLGNFFDCKLDLGGCTLHRQDTVVEDKGHNWYICDSLQWRAATDIEKDTFGWKDSTDGAIKKGKVTGSFYVFDKTAWRAATDVEAKLGGCVTAIVDSVGKVGDVYFICKSDGWTEASVLEYDTYKWPAGKDGEIKKGTVTGTVYVFYKTAWKKANNIDAKLGGCVAAIADSVGKVDSTYYICKFNLWLAASDFECDTYHWTKGVDGDSKLGNTCTKNCYVFEDSVWREGNANDCSLGLHGCTAHRQDTVVKASDNVWYICDNKMWRKAADIEKDTFGWKDSTDGAIKKGNVTGSVYVFDKTAWRMATYVESKLGGCVSAIADSVGKVGSAYFICKSNNWNDANAYEVDTYRWGAGKDGDVNWGNDNTDYCYVYEGNSWRRAASEDCSLGLRGCTALRQDTVGKGSDNVWYICDNKNWRNATDIEKDTATWGAGSFDGEVRVGQVNSSIYYIYETANSAWRNATTQEKDTYDYDKNRDWLAGSDGEIKKGSVTDVIYVYDATAWRAADDVEKVLGGCVTAIADSVGKVGSTYYICSPRTWTIATTLQYDTYKQSCTEFGQIVHGNVNEEYAYFCYGENWKRFYGNESVTYGKLIDDRDGKIYRTVKIGEQTWMAENLNYADSVKTASLVGKSWCYNSDFNNCEIKGRLYTWTAAIDSVGIALDEENPQDCGFGKYCELSGNVRGICPDGWHLPSLDEWKILFAKVCPNEPIEGSCTDECFVGYDECGSIQSQVGWYLDYGGDDSFGFSVLPAGNRDHLNRFVQFDVDAYFWSSSQKGPEGDGDAYYVNFQYTAYVLLDWQSKTDGKSVRCIKDDE